jgi:hypothetical protein
MKLIEDVKSDDGDVEVYIRLDEMARVMVM